MNSHRTSAPHLSTVGLLALGLAACAQRPPSAELLAARTAYGEARRGPAATLAPDKLFEARNALEKAEVEHSRDAQSAEERHFAYIASRVAMIADVYGELARNQRKGVLASQELDRLQDEGRRVAESQLASSEESRGLVITLDSAVLFATNGSELLPTARTRLDEVATALEDLEPGQSIVVEGHTDAVDRDEQNTSLSQRRAESVRDYLVSRGVAQDLISAIGRGEAVPLADGTTPEGRANNRRVEIVIGHQGGGMSPGSGSGSPRGGQPGRPGGGT